MLNQVETTDTAITFGYWRGKPFRGYVDDAGLAHGQGTAGPDQFDNNLTGAFDHGLHEIIPSFEK